MTHLKSAALAAVILSGCAFASPALADCTGPQSSWAQPITNGEIPFDYRSTAPEIARFALPYAQLVTYLRDPAKHGLAPPGFISGYDTDQWFAMYDRGALAWTRLTSFYARTFFHCSANMIVIAFESIDHTDPRDLVVSLTRQIFGGWSPFAVQFVEQIEAAYPDYKIVLTGHSGGGGLAAYAGNRLGLPAISFAPPRNVAATHVSGERQLNITNYGDPISDPSFFPAIRPGGPRAVAGIALWLRQPDIPRPFFELHQLDTIIAGLEALLQ